MYHVVPMINRWFANHNYFNFRLIFLLQNNRSLPEIDGLSKETVLTSWMAKFDCILKGTGDEDSKRPSRMQQPLNSELILSKDQLYDMFQQILGVKKFEHQILFNALMVGLMLFSVLFRLFLSKNIFKCNSSSYQPAVGLSRRTSSSDST